MNTKSAQKYRYHHMGIPTQEQKSGERFSENFGMYTSDVPGDFRIQFHRFEENSPLHPLIKIMPHVALQVDDLKEAVEKRDVILGPYEPIAGYKVAIINEGGVPVELIETKLTIEELWSKSSEQEDLNTDGLTLDAKAE